MPSTAWQDSGASANIGGYWFYLDSRTVIDSISRLNNTITVTGSYSQVRVATRSTGIYFTGVRVYAAYSQPQGTTRRNFVQVASGQINRGDVFSTGKLNYTFTVSANATTTNTNNGGQFEDRAEHWGGGQTISIPAAGNPTGVSTSTTSVSESSITAKATVGGWGANCNAGSDGARIEYNQASGGGWTTLAFSTSLTHSRTFSVNSNEKVQIQTYVKNGAGKTNTSSDSRITVYTPPNAPAIVGFTDVKAISAKMTTKLNAGGEAYTVQNQYRIRETGGSWGSWVTYRTSNNQSNYTFSINNLSPSTEYEVQTRGVTTAGSTTNQPTKTFTTLPAVQAIMPDGTTFDAVPYAILPNGETFTLEIKGVE